MNGRLILIEMPVILRYQGYKFFFFSNEGIPREPIHIHVRKGETTAKIWIDPSVVLAESYGLTSGQQKELLDVVNEHKNFIIRSWHEHFGK